MEIAAVFKDKSTKPSEKTGIICKLLLEKAVSLPDLMSYAEQAKASERASCIEAMEFLTKDKPQEANSECLDFAIQYLNAKEPRVQWESARLISNIAHLYPDHLDYAIPKLLLNTKSSGTVVRWSAAMALSKIVVSPYKGRMEVLEKIIQLAEEEEKISIRKIYADAIKKAKKKIDQ